jgi:hypothetical protein
MYTVFSGARSSLKSSMGLCGVIATLSSPKLLKTPLIYTQLLLKTLMHSFRVHTGPQDLNGAVHTYARGLYRPSAETEAETLTETRDRDILDDADSGAETEQIETYISRLQVRDKAETERESERQWWNNDRDKSREKTS